MLNKRLFLHPVGTMPLQARWYLALCGMMLFALVGLHFAIQVETQTQAEQVLSRWADQAGFKVSNVRYRLLRNALSMDDVVLQCDDMRIHIDSVLMKTGPAALAGEIPDIYELRIRGLDMHVYDSRRIDVWRDVLPDIGVFRIHRWQVDGDIVLDRTGRSLQLHSLHALADEYGGESHWQLSARLAGGRVQAFGVAAIEHGVMQGELRWDDVHADDLSAWLGAVADATRFAGALSWTDSAGELAFDGQAQLMFGQRYASELQWRGALHDQQWRMTLEAEAWPLASMRGLVPAVMDRELRGGLFDGAVALTGDLSTGHWQGSGKRARIVDLSLFDAGHDDDIGWRAGDLSCTDWRIDSARHAVHIGRMQALNVEGRLRPAAMVDATEPLRWRWFVDEMQFRHAQLHIAMAEDDMRVPALQGRLVLKDNRFDVTLATEKGETEDGAVWHLQGHGLLQQGGLAETRLQIDGRKVDLGTLRPVLGLTTADAAMAPVSLAGSTDFSCTIDIAQAKWSIQGKFDIQSLALSHAGDHWYVDELSLAFALDESGSRVLRDVRGRQWRYTAPLTPMSLQPPQQVAQLQDVWWKRLLRDHGWKIAVLRLQQGSIAVGQDDDVWLKNMNLELHDIAKGHWSKMRMQGDWDGGAMNCDGKWNVLATGIQWTGRLHVVHALPFFLRHWLVLSGLPELQRGRWSAAVDMQQVNNGKGYMGQFRFGLSHPLLAASAQPGTDPLQARIGYAAKQVIMRLARQEVTMRVQGDWQGQPLSWSRFGDMVLQRLQTLMDEPVKTIAAAAYTYHTPEAQIRLHEQAGLTPNERLRLRKLLRRVRANKGWLLELYPDIAIQSLDAHSIARIRFTQHLVEDYAVRLGLPAARIYPRWPVGRADGPEVGGIRVIAVSVH